MTSADRGIRLGPTARRWAAAGVVAPLALLAAGCVSTQQKAGWLHVVDQRTLASEHATIVRRAGSGTRVLAVALVHSHGQLAVAVTIHSDATRPLNDLPVSVGLRADDGRRTYLNRATNLPYFDSHVAVIDAGATITWVLAAPARATATGRPFALVGDEPRPPFTVAHTVPRVSIADTIAGSPAASPAGDRLRVTVANRSSVPQTPLLVYALATRRGRVSAAGTATLADVPGGRRSTATVELVGNSRGAHISVEAFPTLF